MDINNRPIGKIEIRIDSIATETDEKGEFEIHGIVPGNYIYILSAISDASKRSKDSFFYI